MKIFRLVFVAAIVCQRLAISEILHNRRMGECLIEHLRVFSLQGYIVLKHFELFDLVHTKKKVELC